MVLFTRRIYLRRMSDLRLSPHRLKTVLSTADILSLYFFKRRAIITNASIKAASLGFILLANRMNFNTILMNTVLLLNAL